MGNQIGDDGARAVSDALKVNSTITSIDLRGHIANKKHPNIGFAK